MVVLIDTNVIIDFLVAREPFYDSALHVMEKCASGEAEGYIAFHSLPNLWYILRKVPAETRRSWLEKVCKILKVASASQEAVMKAIKMDNFKDFEDCLQDRCAEEVSANYIITRNTADFEAFNHILKTVLEIYHNTIKVSVYAADRIPLFGCVTYGNCKIQFSISIFNHNIICVPYNHNPLFLR